MATSDKTIVLITGANSGIGLELSKQLLQKGTYHVILAARSADKGKAALADLNSLNLPGTAELIHLDVTDDDSITHAAEQVQSQHGCLDVLVNNAAIAASASTDSKASLRDRMQAAFNANATGAAVTAQIFAPLLKKSRSPRIVNVSSGAGSISLRLEKNQYYKMGEVQYRASKCAMNMVAACQVAEYEDDGIKVFVFCPGFTESNLSAHNKVEHGAKAVDVSVKPLVQIVEGKVDEKAGKFLNNSGEKTAEGDLGIGSYNW